MGLLTVNTRSFKVLEVLSGSVRSYLLESEFKLLDEEVSQSDELSVYLFGYRSFLVLLVVSTLGSSSERSLFPGN